MRPSFFFSTMAISRPSSDHAGSVKSPFNSRRAFRPSTTLEAIGLPADHGMVRLSFALDTELGDVEAAASILADVALELAKR